jgi:SNF2 family DNA or RNA helicase
LSVLQLVPHPIAPLFRLEGGFPPRVREVFGASLINNTWYFPAYRPACAHVLADLEAVGGTKFPVHLSPDVVAHALAHTDLKPLPADFTYITTPFAHQVDGLTWLYNHPRAGLFYAPGLGKCKIIIDLARLTGENYLIFCPAVVLHTWKREYLTHGGIDDVVVLDGDRDDKEAQIEACVARMPRAVVTTYESATRLLPHLARMKYTGAIFDESHRAKSVVSQRTSAAGMLADRARRRVLLSGTPTLGTPFSLYPQLRLLAPFLCPENWTDFRKRFGVYEQAAVQVGAMHQVKGFKHVDTLRERVLSVCSRRFLEDCIDLPERQIIDVPFELHDDTRKVYNELVVGSVDRDGILVREKAMVGALSIHDGPALPSTYVYAPEVVARLTKLAQIVSGFVSRTNANTGLCNGCPELTDCIREKIKPFTRDCKVAQKVPLKEIRPLPDARMAALEDLLDTLLLDPGNKVLLWTGFIEELERVTATLKKRKIGHVRVEGGMSRVDFENAMQRFETDPDCRVYAGQVASGIGVTLNAANYVVYYSIPWSLEHYDQSLARNYRIGQNRRVTVYRFIAIGSLDEAKAKAIDQKVDIDRLFTASVETTGDERQKIDRIIAEVKPIGESYRDVQQRLMAAGWTNVT